MAVACVCIEMCECPSAVHSSRYSILHLSASSLFVLSWLTSAGQSLASSLIGYPNPATTDSLLNKCSLTGESGSQMKHR